MKHLQIVTATYYVVDENGDKWFLDIDWRDSGASLTWNTRNNEIQIMGSDDTIIAKVLPGQNMMVRYTDNPNKWIKIKWLKVKN